MGVFAPADGRRLPRRGPPAALAPVARPATTSSSGISEMNLFLLLQAARPRPRAARRARCCRSAPSTTRSCAGASTPSSTALYSGARFVVVGTPAGITLAPEGGAHQSTITPSIGLELPGLTYAEPAYAARARLAAVRRAGRPRPTRRRLAVPAAVDPPDRPGAVRRRRRRLGDDAAAGRRARRRLPPARARRRPAAVGAGRVRRRACPRPWPPPTPLDARACRRSSLDLTSPDRLLPRLARRAAGGRRGPAGPPTGGPPPGRAARAGGAAAADRHRPRRRQPPPGLAGRRCSAPPSCRSASTSSASPGSIAELYGLFDLLPDQLVNAALVALH